MVTHDARYLVLCVPEPVEAVAAAHDAAGVTVEPVRGYAPVQLVVSAAEPLVQPRAVLARGEHFGNIGGLLSSGGLH